MSFLNNWRTTAAGIAAILAALTDIFVGLSHGTITSNLSVDIAGIITGIGLIFAQDAHSAPKQ